MTIWTNQTLLMDNHARSHDLVDGEGRPYINVRDRTYGAKGDGTTDDTTAIQNAINAAISAGDPATVTRQALTPVYCPSGIYKVTSLFLRSLEGFKLFGDGRTTIFLASGTVDEILDLNGIAHCTFKDFTVRGPASGTATSAILLRWNGMQRSTTMNEFDNVFVEGGNWVTAWQVGDNTLQVDENQWTNCRVSGNWTIGEATHWQYGWKLGNGSTGNVLDNSGDHWNTNGVRRGVVFAGSGGSWKAGACQNNEVDFRTEAKCVDPIVIKGVRSEGATRLLEGHGATGWAQTVSIEDIDWSANALNADGYFLKAQSGGLWTFDNIFVHQAGAVTPLLWINNAGLGGGGHARIRNVSSKTAGASFIGTSTGFTYDMTYQQNNDSDEFSAIGEVYEKSIAKQIFAATSSGKDQITIPDTTAGAGLTIGGDTNIYRYGANQLATDDQFIVNNAQFNILNDGGVIYWGAGSDVDLYRAGANLLKTDDTFYAVGDIKSTAGGVYSSSSIVSSVDTATAINLNSNGVIYFGSLLDTNIYRSAADTLKTDDRFITSFASGSKDQLQITDTTAGAGLTIGGDTNLYRENANILATDDKLHVVGELELDGDLNHDGTNIGFFTVAPVARASAYTQTYATADKTHANLTSADLTGITSSTTGSALAEPSVGYTQAEMQQNFRRIQDQHNALKADLTDLKQLANSIIDDLQAYGLFQ